MRRHSQHQEADSTGRAHATHPAKPAKATWRGTSSPEQEPRGGPQPSRSEGGHQQQTHSPQSAKCSCVWESVCSDRRRTGKCLHSPDTPALGRGLRMTWTLIFENADAGSSGSPLRRGLETDSVAELSHFVSAARCRSRDSVSPAEMNEHHTGSREQVPVNKRGPTTPPRLVSQAFRDWNLL